MKYATAPFGKMNVAESSVAANALIIKIHAITGWAIPEKVVVSVLKDQLMKKMQEGYATVNPDEVEYAFRTFGTSVKDWGKSMNLALIDEVMQPYLTERSALSKIEEQKKPLAIEHKEDMSDKTYEDWLADVIENVKNGKTALEFVPPMLYDWLHTKREVPNFEDYQKRASIHIGKKLAQNIDPNGIKEYQEYKAMWKKGEFEGKYVTMIPDLAKKICVWNYIFKTEE